MWFSQLCKEFLSFCMCVLPFALKKSFHAHVNVIALSVSGNLNQRYSCRNIPGITRPICSLQNGYVLQPWGVIVIKKRHSTPLNFFGLDMYLDCNLFIKKWKWCWNGICTMFLKFAVVNGSPIKTWRGTYDHTCKTRKKEKENPSQHQWHNIHWNLFGVKMKNMSTIR